MQFREGRPDQVSRLPLAACALPRRTAVLLCRHNVTEIQSWLLSKGLGAYRDALDPLVQACHLLQVCCLFLF